MATKQRRTFHLNDKKMQNAKFRNSVRWVKKTRKQFPNLGLTPELSDEDMVRAISPSFKIRHKSADSFDKQVERIRKNGASPERVRKAEEARDRYKKNISKSPFYKYAEEHGNPQYVRFSRETYMGTAAKGASNG